MPAGMVVSGAPPTPGTVMPVVPRPKSEMVRVVMLAVALACEPSLYTTSRSVLLASPVCTGRVIGGVGVSVGSMTASLSERSSRPGPPSITMGPCSEARVCGPAGKTRSNCCAGSDLNQALPATVTVTGVNQFAVVKVTTGCTARTARAVFEAFATVPGTTASTMVFAVSDLIR